VDGCNPVTLEGCSPSPTKEWINNFLNGAGDSVYTAFTSPSESCVALFFMETANNLNPISPSLESLAGPSMAFGAGIQHNRARAYAASRPNFLGGRGLLYPRRSSTFRAMIARRDLILTRTPVASEAFAMGQALYAEIQAGLNGECR